MNTIPAVSKQLDAAIQAALDNKTKPLGSLGSIEKLAKQIARIQQRLDPIMESCELHIFAADHGVATDSVSAYPQEVTRQMLFNFLAGGAAANVIAKTHGVAIKVINAGINGDSPERIDSPELVDSPEPINSPEHPNGPELINKPIANGTKNFSHEPAMSQQQLQEALSIGMELGLQCQSDALALGEMGIANTSSAAMLVHKLTGEPLSLLVGKGTGLTQQQQNAKLSYLETAASRTADRLDAEDALREYGGFEIVMMAGAMLGAARQKKLILIDGYIVTATAMAASKLNSNLRDYLVFAHQSAELGHRVMLNCLDADPLLTLDMRLGEGTGALMAWPLVRTATAILNDMASFESAAISGPKT